MMETVSPSAETPSAPVANGVAPLSEELVTEGYYRYTDVAFEWAKDVDDAKAAAIRAIIHRECLVHPEHPLHRAGDDGVRLYMGHLADGKERLLFSLKQVEYLRYFIHETRIADSVYLAYVEAARAAGNDGASFPVPPLIEGNNEWVPMPDGITLPAEYEKIEEVVIATGADLKKCFADISKQNKRAGKPAQVKMTPRVDPNTVSPPPKLSVEEQGNEELPQFSVEAGWDEADRADVSAPGLPYEAVPLDDPENALAEKLIELNALAANAGLPQIEVPPEINLNSPEQYFYHAQQAVLLASAGGLAHAQKSDPDAAQTKEETGRSLFVALKLTTWELEEMTVLEAGWAAAWWQQKLVEGEKEKVDLDGKDDGTSDEEEMKDGRKTPSDFSEDDDLFEMCTDQGYYLVQEHLLDKWNGKGTSGGCCEYLHGSSIPLSARELPKTIQKKLKDLSERAGGGPMYIILHSPDADQTEFRKIGWKVSGWEKAIHPEGWEYPSYSAEEGVGKVFLVDTAILFGAIEGETGMSPTPGKTRKSLDEVAKQMFGGEETGARGKTGNAGNAAYECLQVFLNPAQGPTLDELKEKYHGSSTNEAKAKIPSPTVETAPDDPITKPGDDISENLAASIPGMNQKSNNTLHAEVVEDSAAGASCEAENLVEDPKNRTNELEEEDSDFELDQVQSVFYLNADGEMVPLDEE